MQKQNIVMPSQLAKERKNLHLAFIKKVQSFGWVSKDENVTTIKGLYLLKVCKVETSRALSLEMLKQVQRDVQIVTREWMCTFLVENYFEFDLNNFQLCTKQQINKIIRVLKYVIGLNDQAIINYIGETVGRKTTANYLSINEANKVIQRSEKWEAKVLIGR